METVLVRLGERAVLAMRGSTQGRSEANAPGDVGTLLELASGRTEWQGREFPDTGFPTQSPFLTQARCERRASQPRSDPKDPCGIRRIRTSLGPRCQP